METTFFETDWFNYGLLPLLIFLARIVDVSLDTLRIIFVARGNKIVAPILGFVAILIWLLAITRIMTNLDNLVAFLAYPAGFAAGNYIGLLIEEKLAIGIQIVRVITGRDSSPLIENMREGGYTVTTVDAMGNYGPVHILFLIVKRQKVKGVVGIIKQFNPKAFYSIEDVRSLSSDPHRAIQGPSRKRGLLRIKR